MSSPAAVIGARLHVGRSVIWIGAGAIGLIVAAIIGLVVANTVVENGEAGKIASGVSISHVYVGGLTRDAAQAKVAPLLQSRTAHPVVLSFADKSWQPGMADLGATVNLDPILDQALAAPHAGLFGNPAPLNIPLQLQIDDAKLTAYLSGIAATIDRTMTEPTVALTDTTITTTPGSDGYSVDLDATRKAVRTILETLTPSTANVLSVQTSHPTLTQDAVDAFKAKVNAVIGTPYTLTYKDKTWTIDQAQIAKLVTLHTDLKSADPLTYTFDTQPLHDFVAGLAKETDQKAKDAVVVWDSKLVARKTSVDGQALNVDQTLKTLTQNITGGAAHTSALAVDVTHPAIDSNNLDALGIKEVISEGVSSFGGSQGYRAHNIATGIQYLNQTLVPPQSVFSFNAAVGTVDEAHGYSLGYSIVGDETVQDWGGGICQVSTTTFRAAFYAGYPIVERNSHAYRVSWYEEMGEPTGFDAAIYQPGVDFKFKNDTDYYLMIVSYVSNGKAYVDFVSTSRGYKVEMAEGSGLDPASVTPPPPDQYVVDPKLAKGQVMQSDSAHKGLQATVGRLVYDKDGNLLRHDRFFSAFKAWPNIFHYGPGTYIPGHTPDPNPTPAPTQPSAPSAPTNPTATPPAPTKAAAPAPATTPPGKAAPTPPSATPKT